jgi:hypothetical protein
MDARGELDFQIVKDIVEQGHAEARAVIQQDLDRILRRVEAMQLSSAEGTPINGGNTEAMLEEYHARTRNTVVDVITPISERLDALERFRPRTPLPPMPQQATPVDHEALVRDLRAGLVPHIAAATRATEPIDYDVLTQQLSQAVKPHISQLIDLASDKRETAGLIVDRLIPVLPKLFPVAAAGNVDDVVAQIAAEIRRIVAPLDPHEMKEQVSGLVVERLHSRLATRDRVLDALQNKLAQFDDVLEPVKEVASRVAELTKGQEALSMQTRDLALLATDLLSTMPELSPAQRNLCVPCWPISFLHRVRWALRPQTISSVSARLSRVCRRVNKHCKTRPPSFSRCTKTSSPVSWASPIAWRRPSKLRSSRTPNFSRTPSRKPTLRRCAV